ncbi:electron transport complex subunit RsxC [Kangiella sp. TOML190]|uniref:electron transport complex subunit RsxC n=1 Tax=Kangiella sp. TOML190 TaxID=2931351 RepID=UPI00203BD20A|nr:electron transport complex subunit RsxC [Kangiella sp. TOML190]
MEKDLIERSNYSSEIPVYQIPGGVHPTEHKTQSNSQAIAKLPLADELVINLKGQAGNRTLPVVAIGDKVLKGQVIAESDGVFSSFYHAPSSGLIKAIEQRPIAHPSGLTDLCVVLETDGADKWCELTPAGDPSSLSRQEILSRIFESGIVGLGGASFPSHIKLQRQQGIDSLILNAAECEPYITCDDRLLQEHSEQVLLGAKIVASLYSNNSEPGSELGIIIGIEDNKPKAIDALIQARDKLKFQNIKLAVVPTKYPSGGEKQLIQLVTGKQVPQGGLPADLGIVMHNVATCFAIYEAFYLGKPLIDRLVTLTGEVCLNKGNYRIPIGTPIEHLRKASQVESECTAIMGGPMMGFEILDKQAGIVKASNCIIFKSAQTLTQAAELPCIRCGACMDACPASLLPQQLYWHAKADEFEKTEDYNLFDCIECGACAYVCPSNIPLVQYYRYAKSNIRDQKIEKAKSDKARERHEARLERIERVKREKAEKHKKAAEARRKAAEAAGQTDAKKAAVAAALARVNKKKAQASQETDDNTTNQATDNHSKDESS